MAGSRRRPKGNPPPLDRRSAQCGHFVAVRDDGSEDEEQLCVGNWVMFRSELDFGRAEVQPGDEAMVYAIRATDDDSIESIVFKFPDGTIATFQDRDEIEDLGEHLVIVTGPSAPQKSVDDELAYINEVRRRTHQRPLDPKAAGWSDDDVVAEAKRLRQQEKNPKAIARRNPSVNPWALIAVVGAVGTIAAGVTWALLERRFRKRNCPATVETSPEGILSFIIDRSNPNRLLPAQIEALEDGDPVTIAVESEPHVVTFVDATVKWDDVELPDGRWHSSLMVRYPCPTPKGTSPLGNMMRASGEHIQPSKAVARHWCANDDSDRTLFAPGFRGPLTDPQWPSDAWA